MNTQQTKRVLSAKLKTKLQNTLQTSGSKLLFAAMTSTLATTSMASDLDIYKTTTGGAGGGSTIIVMDSSSDMTENGVYDDHPCKGDPTSDSSWKENIETKAIPIKNYQDSSKNTTVSVTFSGCVDENDDTKIYYDRMSQAKKAIAEIMGDPKAYNIKESAKMGLAIHVFNMTYDLPQHQKFNNLGSDGAYIKLIPKALNFEHRKDMLEALSDIVTSKTVTNNVTPSIFGTLGAYMMGTKNAENDDVFSFSHPDSKHVVNGKTVYKSPVTASTCGESSVLLMTAGQPNAAGETWTEYTNSLNIDMESKPENADFDTLETRCSGGVNDVCMQQYAKFLRLPSLRPNTPTKSSVVTAVAAFYGKKLTSRGDKVLKAIKDKGKTNPLPVSDPKTGSTVIEKVYHCKVNLAKNGEDDDFDTNDLCQIAEKGYGYGEGGFDIIDSTDDVRSVILAQLQGQNKVKPSSTGTFSLPINSINPDKSRNVAYLPFLERPESLGSRELWKGNVKKYKVADGTIKGGNDKLVLFDSGLFTKNTYDLWNVLQTADEGKPLVGGVLSKIFATKPGTTAGSLVTDPTRKVYVDDGNGSLKSIAINAADSKPSGFDNLSNAYTADMKRYLAHFLGYPVKDDTVVTDNTQLQADSKQIKHSAEHKIHGAVLHSKPQLIAASSENGIQKDYMLYGSFDGALHVVDDSTGKEKFAFVPQHVLKRQGMYFNPKTSKTLSGEVFGVDGPWTVFSDYSVNTEIKNGKVENTVSADKIYTMGGLRMGGSKYYLLDLTNALKSNTAPAVTVIGSEYGAEGKAAGTGNYARMGQTWGKTNIGFVKTKKAGGGVEKTMVAFLPGGYDMCYEDAAFTVGSGKGSDTCKAKTAAQGNAVYMTKIATFEKDGKFISDSGKGNRLWWASSNASNNAAELSGSSQSAANQVASMKHSIVSEIIPLDRDYDGYTDHLYFSDLGGQVFRVDINNHPKDASKAAEVVRVIRVLDTSSHSGNNSAPRFYESPLVTFMRADWKNNQIVGVVSVGSGNRSRPLHKRDSGNPDRIYTFIDYDLARNDAGFLNTSFDNSLSIKPNEPIKPANLAQLEFSGSSESSDVKTKMTTGDVSNRKRGWYYDLEYWNNATAATPAAGLKMFSPMFALNRVLFFATFNPDGEADVMPSTGGTCDAVNKGATQSDTLCLPFGSCINSGYGKGKYKAQLAGLGIVSNDLGMVEQVSSCTGSNCSSGDPIIKIIKNQAYDACKMGDAGCNPLNSETSIKKRFYPIEWQER